MTKGIFAMNTRRFGTVAEIMVRKLLKAKNSDNNAYDLTLDNQRIEVKFSRALKKNTETITESNVLEQIKLAPNENRAILDKDKFNTPFDCNIQQVKPHEFDVLYYGVFFNDLIYVFKLNSKDISNLNVGYNPTQHRGNFGEGQFHIKNTNINYHIDNLLYAKLSYEQLSQILTNSAKCSII